MLAPEGQDNNLYKVGLDYYIINNSEEVSDRVHISGNERNIDIYGQKSSVSVWTER